MKRKKVKVDKPVFTNLSLLGRFVSVKTDENGFLVLPDFVENNDFLFERVLRYLSNFVKVEVEEDKDTQIKVEEENKEEKKEEKKEIGSDTKSQEETVTEDKATEQEEAKPKRQRRTRSS
ncbi:MAG: hypothetical protein QXX30_03185 [Candidatus Aenigmatarchaeota archaeon]